MLFVLDQIDARLRRVAALDDLLAAVARDIPAAVGKCIDRQHASVLAAVAVAGRCRIFKCRYLVKGQHTRAAAVRPVLGYKRSTEGAHDTGYIGAYDLHARYLLKGTQHRLVVEGTALHDDILTELAHIRQLDDLKEGILYHRICQSRRDIRYRRALLLRLLDIGIHEDGASGAQIHRRLGKERLLREVLCRISQRCGEVLYEGAAAR